MEAKDYEHGGFVEEKVDVEKTQKIEQEVERFFDDVPSPVELLRSPAVDECYEIPAPLDLLRETSPLLNGGVNKSSQVEANKSSLK